MSSGVLMALAERLSAESAAWDFGPKSKVRVGRIYLGHKNPGWPSSSVDLDAELKKYEEGFAKLAPVLADVEFVDGGLVSSPEQLAKAKEKFKQLDGILVVHVTMGIGSYVQSLFDLNVPVMVFTMPYNGHEWHIVGSWQRQGKLIDIVPSSRYEDLAEAIRPFRAIHRLKEARILHVNQSDADAAYCKAIKEKFGTDIVTIKLPELQKAYEAVDRAAAKADADRWVSEAVKVVEPNAEEILRSSIMYLAMKNLMAQYRAEAITMNCLGMALIDRGMGYPCLGFVRLNNMGLGGVCEADLKSTMTHLIFSYLVGKPGFVTDPMFDYSNNTIIHAHCVAATQMEGPEKSASPYIIRSHLEDGKGVSLQVKLPIGQKVLMARLIGTDNMLFSTGDAVDSPLVDRGCRTKLTMRVDNVERFLEHWSCGLHRVVFYGDHTRDLRRFCRFKNIRVLREGIDDLDKVPGLEWEPHVHA